MAGDATFSLLFSESAWRKIKESDEIVKKFFLSLTCVMNT